MPLLEKWLTLHIHYPENDPAHHPFKLSGNQALLSFNAYFYSSAYFKMKLFSFSQKKGSMNIANDAILFVFVLHQGKKTHLEFSNAAS